MSLIIAAALAKEFVASEAVAMCATSDIRMEHTTGRVVLIYGQDDAACEENYRRFQDACAAIAGVGARRLTVSRKGTQTFNMKAVAFANDPFNQIKHWYSRAVVVAK